MRIIAGKHRGRKIETIDDKKLRPTLGIAREAMFNILTHGNIPHHVQEAVVLDLFCGCGSFSMEALSRGAAHVVLIDISQKHLDVARKNIETIHEATNATFIRADSSNPPPASRQCNIVFLDPPYNKNLAIGSLLKAIDAGWIDDHAVVIIETSAKEHFSAPAGFMIHDQRKYGNSKIHILIREP